MIYKNKKTDELVIRMGNALVCSEKIVSSVGHDDLIIVQDINKGLMVYTRSDFHDTYEAVGTLDDHTYVLKYKADNK